MKPISLATLIGMGNHDIEAVIILGQRVIHFFYLAIFDDVFAGYVTTGALPAVDLNA